MNETYRKWTSQNSGFQMNINDHEIFRLVDFALPSI